MIKFRIYLKGELAHLKEISSQEKDLLIAKGLVKACTFECPVYDANGNYVGTQNKTAYQDITITNKSKSGKQKYYTQDSIAEMLRK